MNNYDFNIENYNKKDLEDMLKLSIPYTNEELINRIGIVEVQCIRANPELKEKLSDFLSNVKQKLLKYDDFLVRPNKPTNIEKINPISVKTLTKFLHFDSKFRKNYYSTNATDVLFNLPYTINNTIEIELHEIDIPDSYYQISSLLGNNYFHIVVKAAPGANTDYFTFEVTIPDGNWSTDTFVYYLNNTVFTTDWDEAIISSGLVSDTGYTANNDYYKRPTLNSSTTTGNQRIVASYSTYSNKITIGINNIESSDLHNNSANHKDLSGIELYFNIPSGITADSTLGTFETTSSNLSVREKLGFMMGYKSAKYTGNTSYITESPANLLSSSYFYLILNDFIGNHTESNIIAYTDSYNSKDVFAKISKNNMTPISTTEKQKATQAPNPMFVVSRKYMGPVNIKKLKLSIVDEFGRVIDLNNLDWSCTIKFTYLYE
tara:strand:+ start:35 stop:1333 length:1299 start_codon:yes stop_codon:yes gene_type:complete